MACHEAEALIARRIDGEETPQEARTLDQHLAGCPACVRQLEAERALDAALVAKLGRIEAPPALGARVRRHVETASPAPSRPVAWIPDVLNGAGVLASLLVAAPLAAAVGGGVTGTMVGLAAILVGVYPLLLASWSETGPETERPS